MKILMLHSVGCEKNDWYRKWLSVSLNHFEYFCEYLVNNCIETIFLESYYVRILTLPQIDRSYISVENKDN